MPENSEHHSHHHGPWTREQLSNLERPDREQLMPRGPVIQEVNAPFGGVVADIGAGVGWLTFPLAVAVGQSGKVLAIDPSVDGIQAIRERAEEQQLPQIETLNASAEETGLPDDYVDRLLWHTMYHDVNDRPKSVGEMFRIMKPGGRWIIVDWMKQDMEMGPHLSVRMSPQEVESEVTAAGFRKIREWKAGPVTWGLTFEKP